MTKAESYRKRAKALGKRMSNRQAQRTTPIGRKQKALTDMADNEDWLDGKTKAKGDSGSRNYRSVLTSTSELGDRAAAREIPPAL